MPALALSGSNLAGDAPFSCALRLPDGIHVVRSPIGDRGDLAGLAAALCRTHGVEPRSLQELRVDLGPGSYTGLRVAVTFVRFLQHFGAIPVLACDSLLLLASAVSLVPGPTRLRPLLDARRDRFHCGTLRHTAEGVRHLVEPTAEPLERVLASLEAGDRIVTTAALGLRFASAAAAAGAEIAEFTTLDAGALFSPTLRLRPCDAEQLAPRYLMGSYAES